MVKITKRHTKIWAISHTINTNILILNIVMTKFKAFQTKQNIKVLQQIHTKIINVYLGLQRNKKKRALEIDPGFLPLTS